MREIFLSITILMCLVIVLTIIFVARHSLRHLFGMATPWREHLLAEKRARSLLRDVLSSHEFQQITKYGYLEVASPTNPLRTYRIPGTGGLVKVYDRGCPIMELCLQPIEPLPDGDVIVMHKLMIQTSEEEYLQRANHFAPGIISLRYQHL